MSRQALLVIPLALQLIGCGTSYTTIREEQQIARIHVTSEPANATVYVNRDPRGKTPTYVDLPYVETERKVSPGHRKTGIALLVTGLVGLAAGAGLTYWGVKEMSEGADGGNPVAGALGLSFGPLGALYGLAGAGAGIYLLATSRDFPDDVRTEPDSFLVGVNPPGAGFQEAKIAAINPANKLPRFRQLTRLHYSAETGEWTAPELPSTLQVVAVAGKRRTSTVRRRPRPRPRRTSAIIAVFDIEDRGANLSKPMMQRLSDYLAMKIAATGAFQVVPRDKLKEQLVQQKKASFKQCYDQSCQIEIGRELAAQKSLSTMIVRLGSKCMVTSVLYDLRKAASEGGGSANGGCAEDQIVETLETVVRSLTPR